MIYCFLLQSSLDRGCCSCECSLISDNKEGLQFWRRKLGSTKVDALLLQCREEKAIKQNGGTTIMLNNQCDINMTSNREVVLSSENAAHENEGDSQDEIVIELSRYEMQTYYSTTALDVQDDSS